MHRPASLSPLKACILAGLLAGCQSLGPLAVPRERLDYASAIGESWKQMMLLNIVKQRYLDLPVYLDIDSVISSYSLATSGSIGLELFPNAPPPSSMTVSSHSSMASRALSTVSSSVSPAEKQPGRSGTTTL